MARTVLGLFRDQHDAEDTFNDLKEAGFDTAEISILMREKKEAKEPSTVRNVAGGTVSGITTGAVLGGIAGLVTSIFLPGIGALIVGGPIATVLGLGGAAAATASGAAAGAAAGGIIGALSGLGMSREEAEEYERRIKEGEVFVAVSAEKENEDEARDILEAHHAENVKVVGA